MLGWYGGGGNQGRIKVLVGAQGSVKGRSDHGVKGKGDREEGR